MLFLSVEGGDGSGKSTQASLISKYIRDELKHDVILTKEPGNPHLEECKKIRELLLDPKHDLNERAELFLFLADRAQHINKLVLPSLAEGKYIVMDRYIDSTFVYQSCARGLDADQVNGLINYACFGLKPDLTFVLDLPTDIALRRAKAYNTEYTDGDRMERETIEFHEKVRNGFLQLATTDRRFCVVSVENKTIEEVFEEIKTQFMYRLTHHYFDKYHKDSE